jgi:endonuclease-8
VPEGDAIFRTARALHDALAGKVVTGFDTGYAHLSQEEHDLRLIGRTIEKCEAAGKHCLIFFSGDVILRTHMRMSGSWHLYRPGERWFKSKNAMRVRLDTADWVAVAFDVPVAEFLTQRELNTRSPIAQLGPDLLKPDFDRDEAIRRILASGDRTIAMTLLDQRTVAGIGNVYKSETLFVAGVNPYTPASLVPVADLERVLETARQLLKDNVREGAAPGIRTRRTLKVFDRGSGYDDHTWVYGRRGKPCRKCGTPIEMKKDGLEARPTFWCPECQPMRSG